MTPFRWPSDDRVIHPDAGRRAANMRGALRNEIDQLREEASTLATASNPPEGSPPNREMLRARLREVEDEIDKLLVQWIEETR